MPNPRLNESDVDEVVKYANGQGAHFFEERQPGA
jgi:hypothetical protein